MKEKDGVWGLGRWRGERVRDVDFLCLKIPMPPHTTPVLPLLNTDIPP